MPDHKLRIAKFALINSENIYDLEDIPISSENTDDFEDFHTVSSENNDDLEDIPTQIKLEQKYETGEDIHSEPSSSFKRRKLDEDRSPEHGKMDSQKNAPISEEEKMMQLGFPTQLGKKVEMRGNLYYGPPSSSSSKWRSPEKQVGKNVSFSTSKDSKKNEVKEMKITLPTSEKKTYYCYGCFIELTSDKTKKSHVEGCNHKKMVQAIKAGEPLPEVKQIPNPEPLKKKVPIRLEKKVKEATDPIVGLKFVTEYLAVSDIEMEPNYICKLCPAQGQANNIFSHLKGTEHRKNFVLDKFPDDLNYIDLNHKQLKELASEHCENKRNVSDLITTYNNDDLYPWPESKAPRLTKTGGSGVAPENARENYGKSKAEKYDQCRNLSPERKKERDFSPTGYVASDLPNPESLKRPRSAKEASLFLVSGTDLLKSVLEMDGLFNSKAAKVLKANLTAVINSAAIENTKR